MDLETIALIAMGGCLFLWLVVNFIITLHNVRKAKAAGLTVQVQCEKCGTIYEVTGKEATRPAMVKYKKKQSYPYIKRCFCKYAKLQPLCKEILLSML